MIPDFPHIIRIRLARLKKNCCILTLLCLCPVGCLSSGQRHSNVRTQQNKISIRPILFSYHEESLVSSNFNSKLFRFHCVRPNIHISFSCTEAYVASLCTGLLRKYNYDLTTLHPYNFHLPLC